jgi:hypothetical protein
LEHLELRIATQNDHLVRQNEQMDIVMQQLQRIIDKKTKRRKPQMRHPTSDDDEEGHLDHTPRRLPPVDSSLF